MMLIKNSGHSTIPNSGSLKFCILLFFGILIGNIPVLGNEILNSQLDERENSDLEFTDLDFSNSDHDSPSPFNKPLDSDSNESESPDEKESKEISDSDVNICYSKKLFSNYGYINSVNLCIRDYILILHRRKIIPLFVLQHSWKSLLI